MQLVWATRWTKVMVMVSALVLATTAALGGVDFDGDDDGDGKTVNGDVDFDGTGDGTDLDHLPPGLSDDEVAAWILAHSPAIVVTPSRDGAGDLRSAGPPPSL